MEIFLRPGKPHRDRRVDLSKKYHKQLVKAYGDESGE